jgi:hypothetical protein
MCMSIVSFSGDSFRTFKVNRRLEFWDIFLVVFRYLSVDDTCPMCSTKIDGSRIFKLDSGAAVDSFLAQSSDMS